MSFASSSAGNAYLVTDGDTRILVECGVPPAKLRKCLPVGLSELAGCLVSHEHKDHSRSVMCLLEVGVPVYMSAGTASALEIEGAEVAEHLEPILVGTIDVVPFDVFHDAAEPLGFLLRSRKDGDILVFATDTVNLRYRFPGVNIMAIEANYDKAILERCEKMPEKVRYRITNSHMEIDTLCEYLRDLDLSRCREIHLLHLSDATSHEGHFINKVLRSVPPGINVSACRK